MLLLYETWFIVLMLILCPPLGILLVFKTALWESNKTKIIAVVLGVVWLITLVVGGYLLINYFTGDKNDDITDTPVTIPTIDESNNGDKNPNNSEIPIENPNEVENPGNENNIPNENSEENSNEEPNNNPEENPGNETDKEPVEPIEKPKEEVPVEEEPKIEESKDETGFVELTENEIAKLTDDKKIEYYLQKELKNYEIKIKAITKEKYDISFSISSNDNASDLFKEICETIVALNYRDKFMEVVLTVNADKEKKIMTIKNLSKEMLPNINYSIYENGKFQNKQITVKINLE